MKAAKGTVAIQVFRDRLRLVWSYAGKRYFLYLGLPDSELNRRVARTKAGLIEGDLATGNFDRSLNKYKLDQGRTDRQSVLDLFSQFVDRRSNNITSSALSKYRALTSHLKANKLSSKIAANIVDRDCLTFKEYCLKLMALGTFKRYLGLLNSCWNWAIEKGWLTTNPWKEIEIKVPPKQKATPFTIEEVRQIVSGFRESRHYRHYADYVEFLFGTGARLGEASGLRWRHVDRSCRSIWIGESTSNGTFKATKTNRDRQIILSDRLSQLLSDRKAELKELSGDTDIRDLLVFPAPKGGAIDHRNFRNRGWEKVLAKVGIEYRRPYVMRSTAASHLVESGFTPLQVAEILGCDVGVLYKHYLGNVSGTTKLPDFL